MTDLLELASRCEAAKGPDRRLDALIWCAINPPAKLVGKRIVERRNDFAADSCSEFTASLDAALTLVPEGWDHIEVYRPDYQTLGWTVHFIGHGNGPKYQAEGFAKTFALAVCAAALRARSVKS